MRLVSCIGRQMRADSSSLLQKRWVFEVPESPENLMKLSEADLKKMESQELYTTLNKTHADFTKRYFTLEANYGKLKEEMDKQKDENKKKEFLPTAQKMEALLAKLQGEVSDKAKGLAGVERENVLQLFDRSQEIKMQLMEQRNAGKIERIQEVLKGGFVNEAVRDIKHILTSNQGGFLDRAMEVMSKYGEKIGKLWGFAMGEAGAMGAGVYEWWNKKEEKKPDKKAGAGSVATGTGDKTPVASAKKEADERTKEKAEKEKKDTFQSIDSIKIALDGITVTIDGKSFPIAKPGQNTISNRLSPEEQKNIGELKAFLFKEEGGNMKIKKFLGKVLPVEFQRDYVPGLMKLALLTKSALDKIGVIGVDTYDFLERNLKIGTSNGIDARKLQEWISLSDRQADYEKSLREILASEYQ